MEQTRNTHINADGREEWNSVEDFLNGDVRPFIEQEIPKMRELLDAAEAGLAHRTMLAVGFVQCDFSAQPYPPEGTDRLMVLKLYADALGVNREHPNADMYPQISKEEAPVSDLKTPAGVAAYMREAKGPNDWNNRCDAVKAANGNDYPSFWFATVVMSGLAAEVQARW